MGSQIISNQYLKPLLAYLKKKGHISRGMRSEIKVEHSFEADFKNERSRSPAKEEEAARSFCFVILGERTIYYASALKALPESFITGILLHEIAHMIVENERGDPELTVDEWVIANVPEAGYAYKNVRYIDFTGKPRTAKNLECVTEDFLIDIGVMG